MRKDILIKNVDITLLKQQRNYLLNNYITGTNKNIDGLICLLDHMLDIAEGFD